MSDISAFSQRLIETVTWCAVRLNLSSPATSLRSPLLKPDIVDLNKAFLRYEWDSVARRPIIVDILASKRAALLSADTLSPDLDISKGRFLVYRPDDNLYDGAAEVKSQGFFDSDNAPPWDTWVSYIEDLNELEVAGSLPERRDDSYLLSWVPPQYLGLADRGIWANPEKCIRWVNDVASPFESHLAAAGFIRPV